MANKHTTSIGNSSSVPLPVNVTLLNEKEAKIMLKVGESKKFGTDYGEMKVKLSFLGCSGNWLGYNTTQVDGYEVKYDQTIGSNNSYIIKEENRNGTKELKVIEARYGTLWQEH